MIVYSQCGSLQTTVTATQGTNSQLQANLVTKGPVFVHAKPQTSLPFVGKTFLNRSNTVADLQAHNVSMETAI